MTENTTATNPPATSGAHDAARRVFKRKWLRVGLAFFSLGLGILVAQAILASQNWGPAAMNTSVSIPGGVLVGMAILLASGIHLLVHEIITYAPLPVAAHWLGTSEDNAARFRGYR